MVKIQTTKRERFLLKIKQGFIKRLQLKILKLVSKHERISYNFWENLFEKYRETNPIFKQYDDYEAFTKSPYSISINKNTGKISIEARGEGQSQPEDYIENILKRAKDPEEAPVVH